MRKKQAKSRYNSRISKSPPTHYLAYINAKGIRVTKGTRGSKPIKVKINRAALVEHAKTSGRIGGKFAPKLKAKLHAKRVAAGKKAWATRVLAFNGVIFQDDYVTKIKGHHYRAYRIATNDPEHYLVAMHDAVGRGFDYFYVNVGAIDDEGDEAGFSTGYFRAENDANADHVSNAVNAIMNQYQWGSIEEITMKFTHKSGKELPNDSHTSTPHSGSKNPRKRRKRKIDLSTSRSPRRKRRRKT